MNSITNLSRRDFLKTSGALTGGLVLGVALPACGKHPARDMTGAFEPNVFIRLAGDGAVTIIAHRSEMGQGIRTGLPQVLADEMEADWSRVTVQQGDADSAYGSQNTDGSRSIRRFFQPMREAGATARSMLVAAAAKIWQVDAGECVAQNHTVRHLPSGRSLRYGRLANVAAGLPVPDRKTLKLKAPEEFRYIGKGLPIVDMHDITVGKAGFGIDVAVPGMLYAAIQRPPALGDKLKSFDAKAALATPGVVGVQRLPDGMIPTGFNSTGGVAVLAHNTWAAISGRGKLNLQWNRGPNGGYNSSGEVPALLANSALPGEKIRARGDVEAAFKSAAKIVEARYQVPMLAHAPMEPPCATAIYKDGHYELFAAVQDPQAARDTIAQALGVKPDAVTVHVTLLGGAFGRKSKPDHAVEAARSAQMTGKPVKVTWTREDDVQHDFYHAASAQYLKAGLDGKGRTRAWLHRTVFPTIAATFDGKSDTPQDWEVGMGCVDVPFAIDHIRIERGKAKAQQRIGWLRSVCNIQHAFAVSSFVDELAHASGQDPAAYLRTLIGPDRHVDLLPEGAKNWNYGEPIARFPVDTARLKQVLDRVVEVSGWGRDLPKGHGLGIAVHRSFVSYIAVVVEASVDAKKRLRVRRIDMVVDCGQVVNPDRVRAQMEGAAVFGLSIALHGEITAADGAVAQSNFHDYPVARINEVPPTHVLLMESDEIPSGVGEPGVPPIAPALANAIFAATGKRYRRLPLKHELRVV